MESEFRKARNMKTGEIKYFISEVAVFNFCKENPDWLNWRV